MSVWVGAAPIRSAISLSCQFSFWDRTYTIGHYRACLASRSLLQYDIQSHIFQIWHLEPLCILIQIFFDSPCFLSFSAFRVVLLTWLLGAYRLFIIALLDFPFHCTWHSSLSPWRIFRSCYWTPYTWHSRIVHIEQSPSGTFFLVLQGGSTVTHLWHRSLSHFWRHLRGSLDP